MFCRGRAEGRGPVFVSATPRMQRVMIVGGPGSGKSSLARELGEVTGLPVYHMDLVHWKPGWTRRPMVEKWQLVREIEEREAWIFEGGYSATFDSRAARADTLIWLDLPVALRLWRVTKRLARYWGRSRPDLPTGCVEGLNRETWVFFRWIWTSRTSSRRRVERLIEQQDGLGVYHLKSRSEVRRFLKQVACP